MTALPAMPVTGHAASTLNFETLNQRVVKLEARKNLKPGAPAAQVARETAKEFEPSATKDALVLLELAATAGEVATGAIIKVGGIQVGAVGFPKLAEAATSTVTFPVPAGKKWEVAISAGKLSALNSSYAFLD